jgi:DNA-binding transcriptional regulator YiaG
MSEREIRKGSAAKLLSIRKKLRLSQSKFADKLGVVSNTYARWERGDLIPPKVAEVAAEGLLLKHKLDNRKERRGKV